MYKFRLNSLKRTFKVLILTPFILLLVIKFDINLQLARSIGRNIKVSFGRLKNYNSSCNLPLIKNVPKDSTIIIGHAYGSHKKTYKVNLDNLDFIAPKISAFLDANKYL